MLKTEEHNTEENIEAFVQEHDLAIVKFYANWCGPCAQLTNILERTFEKSDDYSVNVAEVNVDKSQEYAKKWNVRSIPTMLFYKDGEHVKTVVGLKQPASLKNLIDEINDSE